MPEGPEIKQEADRIAKAICGSSLVSVEFAFDHLRKYGRRFRGDVVEDVESRGKALLTHLSSGHTIYSHNQLYGRWYVVPAGRPPKTNRSLRLALRTADAEALLYSASEIEVLPTDEVDAHPFVSKLGPDVLRKGARLSSVRKQLDDPSFRNRQLGALLLDQSFVAGIGNYLRSDILHAAGLHPSVRPVDLDDETRDELARAIRDVTRQSYRTGGITNDLRRVRRLKSEGLTRRAYRHLVFNRDGEACYTCGGPIQKIDVSTRRLYLCPVCQPASETA